MASYTQPTHSSAIFNADFFSHNVIDENADADGLTNILAGTIFLFPDDEPVPVGYETVTVTTPVYMEYTGG